jgi:hypothetical protein
MWTHSGKRSTSCLMTQRWVVSSECCNALKAIIGLSGYRRLRWSDIYIYYCSSVILPVHVVNPILPSAIRQLLFRFSRIQLLWHFRAYSKTFRWLHCAACIHEGVVCACVCVCVCACVCLCVCVCVWRITVCSMDDVVERSSVYTRLSAVMMRGDEGDSDERDVQVQKRNCTWKGVMTQRKEQKQIKWQKQLDTQIQEQ